jgi:hypothetical protein
MSDEPKRRAPLVAERLEAARGVVAELEQTVGEAALAEIENGPGAAKAMQALDAKIRAAKAEVDKLEAAHRHALKADFMSLAAGAHAMRIEQFAVMKSKADARMTAFEKLMAGLATMAAAMSEYAILTNEMVVSLPSGTALPSVGLGKNNWAGSWVGNLSTIISGEALRLGVPDENGRGARLPFARQVELTNNNPAEIEPAVDLMRQAQAAVLRASSPVSVSAVTLSKAACDRS